MGRLLRGSSLAVVLLVLCIQESQATNPVTSEISQWCDGFDPVDRNRMAGLFDRAADLIDKRRVDPARYALDLHTQMDKLIAPDRRQEWSSFEGLVRDLFQERVKMPSHVSPFYRHIAAGLRVALPQSLDGGNAPVVPVAQVSQKPIPVGAPPRILVDFSEVTAGDYHLRVGTGGSLSLAPIVIVTPGGTPPKPPTPTGLSERVKQTADQINDPETTRKLIVGYQVVLIKGYSSITAIGTDAKKIADEFAAGSKWSPFRSLLQAEFTKAAQEGRLTSVEDYKKLLTEVRSGLLSSLSEDGGAINIMLILQIIRIVLDIIEGEDLNIIEIIRQILDIFSAQGMEVALE